MTAGNGALSFRSDGAERYHAAAGAAVVSLRDALPIVPPDRAGLRISGIKALRRFLLHSGAIGVIAAEVLGPRADAVRAILFDKTAALNWSVAWHQDRTISVVDHLEVDGFGPWTTKRGMHHVVPPIDLLVRMVTLRVHLDDVPDTNAPLLIAPGSHRLGRVSVDDIDAAIGACGVRACLATAGDTWLYATTILHASEIAKRPARRRVLQADYSADELPGGLRWSGVCLRPRSAI